MESLYTKHRPHWKENESVSELINAAIRRGDGKLAANGCLLMDSGRYTGRSPKDRFIVRDAITNDTVAWGDWNRPMEGQDYLRIKEKVFAYIEDREMFLVKARVGADPRYGMRINVLAENAGQALFASQIFIKDRERNKEEVDFTVIAVPSLKADPKTDGVRSEAFIVVSMTDKLILIGGTYYSGEIKKAVFSVMNYLLPERGVLPMHCSANKGADGDTVLFFGLSGTGKTTLSADPNRRLIGDDEHGWTDEGVFNFEGGCYAKTIHLHPEKEKEIYDALRFGSLLENVVVDEDGNPDYNDDSRTENTRGTYPITYIANSEPTGGGGLPKVVIFLTADAFGVLPPISRLTKEGAMYHFMSGYTSKLAGTERDVTEPQTTFSALFGEPFMLRPIEEYARLLGQKLNEHDTEVYLINTGWIGGKYGVGDRMPLSLTRRMVTAAVRGELKEANVRHDPIFNLDVPVHIDGVPDALLNPQTQWHKASEYKKAAKDLAAKFRKNFQRFPQADASIVEAGPME